MEQHAGIDVSLEWSSVCVVDASGKIVREIKVASEPEVLVEFFKGLSFPVTRIGLEAGPLSQWLHAGLTRAGFETVLLETRHVKAALSAMSIKTDRNDARGIAQLMRMGWFRPVHAKSVGSREVRALLVARKQLLSKLMDLEASMRGILRGFGIEDSCRDPQGIGGTACGNFPPARRCRSGSRRRCWRQELRFPASSSNCTEIAYSPEVPLPGRWIR